MIKEPKRNLRMKAFCVVVDKKLVYDGTSYAIYMDVSSANKYCECLHLGNRAEVREIKMDVGK